MNNPKRHHYIPQMLLRRFADDSGKLYWYNKNEGTVKYSSPKNVFLEKNLYSLNRLDGENSKYEIERQLALLEGDISDLLDEITSCIQYEQTPILAREAKINLLCFLVALSRRTPKAREVILALGQITRRELLDASDQEQRPVSEEIRVRYEDPEKGRGESGDAWRRSIKLAQEDPKSSDLYKLLQTKQMKFGIIQDKENDFIVGSLPFVKLRPELILTDEEASICFPVSSKIIICFGPYSKQDSVLLLHDAFVKDINRRMFEQSETIAGNSKNLITTVVENRKT